MTLKSSPLALNRNRSCQHKASPSLFPHLVEGTSAIRPHPTSISHIRTFISDNHQKCIVTNWQCIGMHWHRSHQSHANRRTVAYISGELVYYVDRPKCLNGGRFHMPSRQSGAISHLQFEANQVSIQPILCQSDVNQLYVCNVM